MSPPRRGELTVVVGRHTFATIAPTVVRDGVGYIDHARGKQLERAIALELAHLGDTSPEAFRFMRKALGFRITDLSELLDISPEIVKSWESGEQPVARAAWALLSALVVEAEAGTGTLLGFLRAAESPPSAADLITVSPFGQGLKRSE